MNQIQQNIQPITRLSSIDNEEFFENYYLKNQPVVVENFAKEWPAIQRWDASYLSRNLNDAGIVCSQSSTNKHPDFNNIRDNRYIPKSMNFDDYIKHICLASEEDIPKIAINRLIFMSGEKCDYRKHLNLDGLQDDFIVPQLLPLENLELGAIWIQGQNTQSWMHFDPFENLYVQIQGKKRLLLVPPEHSCGVYYNNKRNGYCELDAFEPDHDAFPLYQSVPIYETELQAGEMLYIPIHWFHAVESLDVINVTTNWWYRPTNIQLSQPALAHTLSELVTYAAENAGDNQEAQQKIIDVASILQELVLGPEFATLDDFYFRAKKP
jgi:tRNA wybutosine-synthesizing protein 5